MVLQSTCTLYLLVGTLLFQFIVPNIEGAPPHNTESVDDLSAYLASISDEEWLAMFSDPLFLASIEGIITNVANPGTHNLGTQGSAPTHGHAIAIASPGASGQPGTIHQGEQPFIPNIGGSTHNAALAFDWISSFPPLTEEEWNELLLNHMLFDDIGDTTTDFTIPDIPNPWIHDVATQRQAIPGPSGQPGINSHGEQTRGFNAATLTLETFLLNPDMRIQPEEKTKKISFENYSPSFYANNMILEFISVKNKRPQEEINPNEFFEKQFNELLGKGCLRRAAETASLIRRSYVGSEDIFTMEEGEHTQFADGLSEKRKDEENKVRRLIEELLTQFNTNPRILALALAPAPAPNKRKQPEGSINTANNSQNEPKKNPEPGPSGPSGPPEHQQKRAKHD